MSTSAVANAAIYEPRAVEHMAAEDLVQNRAVTLLLTDQQLTMQQAADMLGVT